MKWAYMPCVLNQVDTVDNLHYSPNAPWQINFIAYHLIELDEAY